MRSHAAAAAADSRRIARVRPDATPGLDTPVDRYLLDGSRSGVGPHVDFVTGRTCSTSNASQCPSGDTSGAPLDLGRRRARLHAGLPVLDGHRRTMSRIPHAKELAPIWRKGRQGPQGAPGQAAAIALAHCRPRAARTSVHWPSLNHPEDESPSVRSATRCPDRITPSSIERRQRSFDPGRRSRGRISGQGLH